MPVADGFRGGLVRIDGDQLKKRSGHFPALPTDLHKHVMFTRTFHGHAQDFDGLALPERRTRVCGDAFRRERETELAFEVLIPAHCLLFRSCIDDGFVLDAVFANRIFSAFGHRATKVLPGYC